RTNPNILVVPQNDVVNLFKWIDDKYMSELRCLIGRLAVVLIELRAVLVDLFKAFFIACNGDKTQLIAGTKLHSYQGIQSMLMCHADEVQGCRAVVDIRQHSRVIAIGEHAFEQFFEAQGTVTQAVITMYI